MKNITERQALLQDLENLRKKAMLYFVLFIILASLCGVGGFSCIILATILEEITPALKGLLVGLGFLLFLGGTSGFTFLAIKKKNSYRQAFETSFAPRFALGVYEEYHYHFAKDVSEIQKMSLLPLKVRPDSDATSFSEGKAEGLAFFSYAYSHVKAGKGHPDESFGRYVQVQLSEDEGVELLLVAKKGKTMFNLPKLKESFESESLAFNAAYDISASSHLEALKVLTPAFLDGVTTLNQNEKGRLSLYLHKQTIVLYFEDYPSFVLSFARPLKDEDLLAFEQEVLLPKKIIEALHLR